jgi:hypothetical protein
MEKALTSFHRNQCQVLKVSPAKPKEADLNNSRSNSYTEEIGSLNHKGSENTFS